MKKKNNCITTTKLSSESTTEASTVNGGACVSRPSAGERLQLNVEGDHRGLVAGFAATLALLYLHDVCEILLTFVTK